MHLPKFAVIHVNTILSIMHSHGLIDLSGVMLFKVPASTDVIIIAPKPFPRPWTCKILYLNFVHQPELIEINLELPLLAMALSPLSCKPFLTVVPEELS